MNEIKFVPFGGADGAWCLETGGILIPRPLLNKSEAVAAMRELTGQRIISIKMLDELTGQIIASSLPDTREAYVRTKTGSTNSDFCSGVIPAGQNRAGMTVFQILLFDRTVDGLFASKEDGQRLVRTLQGQINEDEGRHLFDEIERREGLPATTREAVAKVTGQTGILVCGVARSDQHGLPGWVFVGERGELSELFRLRREGDLELDRMITQGRRNTAIRGIDESIQIQRLFAEAKVPETIGELMKMALKSEDEPHSGIIPDENGFRLVISQVGAIEVSWPFRDKRTGQKRAEETFRRGLTSFSEASELINQIKTLDLPEEVPEGNNMATVIDTMISFGPDGPKRVVLVNGKEVEDETILALLDWARGGDQTDPTMLSGLPGNLLGGLFGASLVKTLLGSGNDPFDD